MIEIVPPHVDSAFLYFHTRCSTGNELAPFLPLLQTALPNTYLWAGDGPVEGQIQDPLMGEAVNYGQPAAHNVSVQRYWFVFPMHSSTPEGFTAAREAMGAVLATAGGYANILADQVMLRFGIPAQRVVLCGHQHGGCVALAAAMMRRAQPYALTVLFDPWPLEALYLEHEHNLPQTRVMCVDNRWVRERERQRGVVQPLFQTFQEYGINARGVTLESGEGRPDAAMFGEAARLVRESLGCG